jgi:hypothetical protein
VKLTIQSNYSQSFSTKISNTPVRGNKSRQKLASEIKKIPAWPLSKASLFKIYMGRLTLDNRHFCRHTFHIFLNTFVRLLSCLVLPPRVQASDNNPKMQAGFSSAMKAGAINQGAQLACIIFLKLECRTILPTSKAFALQKNVFIIARFAIQV